MKLYWLFTSSLTLTFVFQTTLMVPVPPFKTTIQMIIDAKYPYENHYITTFDGYILNFHRIPPGKKAPRQGKVVYLQHGLFAASSDWVLMAPDKSLAYLLADEGYDVWMGNYRGNFYSRNHTWLNPDVDDAFWDFSFHEMGLYDIPAGIDYILNATGVKKLYYIGHSMGTTAFYVMGSERSEYLDKIQLYMHLSPVAYCGRLASPLFQALAPWWETWQFLGRLLDISEFLSHSHPLNKLLKIITSTQIGAFLGKTTLFVMAGFDHKNMDNSITTKFFLHYPAGTSFKTVMHYLQLINHGEFQQFDYGQRKNLLKYGTMFPPSYNLKKLTSPGILIYAQNDWLSSLFDVERLVSELGYLKGKMLVPYSQFNHFDYLFGDNAHVLIYPTILNIFRKM